MFVNSVNDGARVQETSEGNIVAWPIGKDVKITERMYLEEPNLLIIDTVIVAPNLFTAPVSI